MKGIKGVLTGILLAATLFVPAVIAQAGTIYQSPYVTFSSDGKAFTTCAGDKTGTWYDPETSEVNTGIASTLRALRTGEHYYKTDREGNIPIGKWKVAHKTGICCHDNYPNEDYYYGVKYRKQICSSAYYSGWTSYCADCKEEISPLLIYMSREAAVSITQLDVNLEYYYTCPICTNMEQGSPLGVHMCEKISWNRYIIDYKVNTAEVSGGYMERSTHMYNNATDYEGKPITPATHLTKSAYTRMGYEFTGWNTKPDGSGTSFKDSAPTWNLTTENFGGLGSSKGVITLYAQWKHSESTLHIDPAGGSYEGKTGMSSYKKAYGEKYIPDSSKLISPSGNIVSFDSKGGKPVGAMAGKKSFVEWSMSVPFRGKFLKGIYFYAGKDGTSDTLTATYRQENIILPLAEKDNSSFGGWYYDTECTNPAGTTGDGFTPTGDITLYAKWVELVLTARDNYIADGGRGAVNLSWAQKDGNSKTYLLFQSRDNLNWMKVSGAEDITNSREIKKEFIYQGKAQTYTIPYSGMYILTASGAQGGNYDTIKGGTGGAVSGKVWLNKGEIVTYTVGGQDGYNGGGKGSMYGNGGGCTIITSNQKGNLLIAGGGGGATSQGAGGAGGSTASNLTTGTNGQDGGAGGGGGFQGGTAGKYVVHNHTKECWKTDDLSYTLFQQMPNVANTSVFSPEFDSVSLKYGFTGSYFGQGTNEFHATAVAKGKASAYANISNVPINGNTQVEFHVMMDTWNQFGFRTQDPVYDQWGNIIGYDPRFGELAYVKVYTQDGTCIYDNSAMGLEGNWSRARANAAANSNRIESFVNSLGGYWGTKSGWFWSVSGNNKAGQCQAIFNETVDIPEGTTSLNFVTNNEVDDSWFNVVWSKIRLKGGVNRYTTCGYKEGEIISAAPAYGGSNYINADCFLEYSGQSGVRPGNGIAGIESVEVGYLEELSLQGVRATDLAAPDAIAASTVTRNPISQDEVSISWQSPRDNGTAYYHKAESYLAGSTQLLSRSNITVNQLTSGIKGYYYLVDQSASTAAGSGNSIFLNKREGGNLSIPLHADVQYLHLAAVDVAGNVGATTHVQLGRKDTEVAWKLATDKLHLSSGENNIHPAGTPDTYYVRCDGKTPFTMTYNSFVSGQASASYQINHTIFESALEGEEGYSQRYDIFTPSHAMTEGNIVTKAEGLEKEITGEIILEGGTYTVTTRSDALRRLKAEQQFVLGEQYHGKTIRTIPIAGAVFKKEVQYSDRTADEANAIRIIGDLEAPLIQGAEILEGLDLINRGEGNITLVLTATDELSGVREFSVEVSNKDNAGSRTWYPGEDGRIELDITKDSLLFYGDFSLVISAIDHVGNVRQEAYGATEFTLSAKIERILAPHDPIFQTGESGILTIETGGYADRVEVVFPKEMLKSNPQLNKVYEYEVPRYLVEEELKFMVPLYTKEGSYHIQVYAYKGGRLLQEEPALAALEISGTVTDDFRTRLR